MNTRALPPTQEPVWCAMLPATLLSGVQGAACMSACTGCRRPLEPWGAHSTPPSFHWTSLSDTGYYLLTEEEKSRTVCTTMGHRCIGLCPGCNLKLLVATGKEESRRRRVAESQLAEQLRKDGMNA